MDEMFKEHPLEGWRAALTRLEGAYADNTVRGYRSDFARFEGWCKSEGLRWTPAAPSTIAQFIQADAALSASSTLKRRLAAIRKVHLLLDLPSPLESESVRLAYRAALRSKRRRPQQAAGLTAVLRDQLMAACRPGLLGLRDRALIAVGYDTLCRRTELVSLLTEDMVKFPSGAARILVRRAKTDPFGDGRWGHLGPRAFAAAKTWLEAAGIESGPLFRPLHQGRVIDDHLHAVVVNRTLKLAAIKAGLPSSIVRGLSGHSMRVGAAQDLVGAGCDLMQIMTAGGWTSINVVAGYARDANFNIWTRSNACEADFSNAFNAGSIASQVSEALMSDGGEF